MKINLFVFLLSPFVLFSQQKTTLCEKLNQTLIIINQEHFKPKPINDSLSVYFFDAYFESLDKDKTLFLKSEIETLSKYRLSIDNEILENNCLFFTDFFQLYKKALNRKKKYIEEIEKEKNLLVSKDTLFFSKKKVKPLNDETKLKKLIRKRIVFDIFEGISNISKNKDSLLIHFESLSREFQQLTFERYKCEINSLLSDDDTIIKTLQDQIISIVCSYFDPHTHYFSGEEKDNYLMSLRTTNETFGIEFNTSDSDNLIVSELIPGSVAYLSDKIESGDQLVRVKILQEEFPVQCNYFPKLEELFSDSNKKVADFTFRKKNGEVYTLTLEKKQLKNIENEVFSSVVVKNNKSFGYIRFPSFYTDELNENTASKDVAKAIINLKSEQVEGLIIDLQNNGGGSIVEAINLVGMFIDVGPVSVLVDNEGKKNILKDVNRGMISNQPIIVIVNGFSASASEFFANAIQDYKRGIIIGSKTFGKGTAQYLLPLEFTDKTSGFLKITKEKFYRINGKSHQKTGVEPDIYLPSIMESIIPNEAKEVNALESDFLTYPIRYEAMKNDFNMIIKSGKENILQSEYFNKIITINKQIDNYLNGEKKPIRLTFSEVFDYRHNVDSIYTEMNELSKTTFDFAIKNTQATEQKIKHDDYLQKYNIQNQKQLQSNAYAYEAIQLLLKLTN